MIEACRCEDGLGVKHSHLTEQFTYEGHLKTRWTDRVQIWVDWKAVARAFSVAHSDGTGGGE